MPLTNSEIAALTETLARGLYESFYRLTQGVGFPGAYPMPATYDELIPEQQAVFRSMASRIYHDPRVRNFWACQSQLELGSCEEDCAECQT